MKELTRREALKYGTAGIGFLSLSNLLYACSKVAANGTVGGGEIGTLNIGLGATVTNLDPATFTGFWGLTAGIIGLERLIQPNDSGKIVPWIAESWSFPDPKTCVLKIRNGVKFWDGSLLTADDVAFSLNLSRASTSQTGYYFGSVHSIEATGPYEVTANLSSADPLFVPGLTYSPIYPKPFVTAQGTKLGTPAGSNVTIMGSGPFKFTSFSDSGISAVRNENYWGPLPKIKNINFQFISDPQTLQLAFRAGSIDWAPSVPLDQAPQWQSIPHAKVLFSPPLTTIMLAFNVNKAPFDDVHVRRAVAHCCDTHGMVNALLHGHGQPATTIVPPAQWGSAATPAQAEEYYKQVAVYPFDLTKAKAELAQSSSPGGFTATIEVGMQANYYEQAMLAISRNLQQIGITLNVKQVPTTQWAQDTYFTHNQSIYFVQLLPDYANPADYTLQIYPSSQAMVNGQNYAGFKNAQVDAYLQAWPTNSPAQQVQDVLQTLKISGEELPYIPLWWEPLATVLNEKDVYGGTYLSIYYEQQWSSFISAAT